MKKYIAILMAVIVVLISASSVLAASLGVSPSRVELEVPADGSVTADFQVHYFNGDVKVSLVDIPLRVEPEVVSVDALAEPVDVELTIYGDPSLGSEVYNGYIEFLGMSGEMISVAVQVRAKVTNIVEGQAIPKEKDSGDNEAAGISSPAPGGMDASTRNIIIIVAVVAICAGLVILTVSLTRRR